MRILHVTPYFAPAFCYGGPPRSILGLCQGLQRAGIEIAVLTTSANGDSELSREAIDASSYAGIPVRYLTRSFPKQYFHVAELADILKTEGSRYDLVHLHGCWNLFCWQAARICRRDAIPYLVSTRGMLEPWSFNQSKLKKWLAYYMVEKANLASAEVIHVTSHKEKQSIERLGLVTKIAVMPNGINCAEYQRLPDGSLFRSVHNIGLEELIILYLGRLHPTKGLEILGEAFQIALNDNLRARLVIAGDGDRAYVAVLRKRFQHLLNSNRLILTGHLDTGGRLAAYAASDIFALTSHSENFGLVIAEAMAARLPVVLSQGCPWPQIEESECGYWVQNNPKQIAEALLKLSGDQELRDRMGTNGRRYVFETLDWTRIAERMRTLYEECLGLYGSYAKH